MRSLSVAVLLLAFTLSSAQNWRHNPKRFQPPCCIKFTTTNVAHDVTENTYRKPPVTVPCVEAIILTTSRGPLCVDPKTKWVKELIANMTKL